MSCNSCKYFKEHNVERLVKNGDGCCQYNPPVVVVTGEKWITSVFPTVLADDICSKHEYLYGDEYD